MYRKIRITVASLAVVMICLLSSTATLSFFTDSKTATNSFTVGNASTTLATYNHESGDSEHVFDAEDYVLTDGRTIPFYLQATNDGNIPVYQRFRVVIPIGLADVVTLNLPDCVISPDTGNTCNNQDYTVTYNPSVVVEETPTYAEYYIVSNNILAVGDNTVEWPTEAIQIGDLSELEDKSLFTCENNDSNNCIFGISTYSDVIQTTGFASAIDAFANSSETY
ncbi:SipW-dependent-type signal peptide-containing protein [Candidatus Saccharibacteria bacterium]|nr:SipW-dependent-type signal peptide-containing protein [Candidatus Saccharibacteria bacterium]